MRVIGTGWRHWATSDRAVEDMCEFMDKLLDLVLMTTDPVLQLILGGGDENDTYTQGADRYLYLWAEANTDFHGEVKVPAPMVWPADWATLGPAAEPIRNANMIIGGADLVVGFLHPDSKDTRDCLDKARRAKIPTMTVAWRPDQDPVTTKPEAKREAPRRLPLSKETREGWPAAKAA